MFRMAPTKVKTSLGAIVKFVANGEAIGQGRVTKCPTWMFFITQGYLRVVLKSWCFEVLVLDAFLPQTNPLDEDTNLQGIVGTIIAWPKNDMVSCDLCMKNNFL